MNTSKPGSQLNTQIYQEACEWLVTFRTGGADAATKAELDAWLRKSPEHVRAYLEVNAIWEDSALHDPQHATTAEAHIHRARTEDNVVTLEPVVPLAPLNAPPETNEAGYQVRQTRRTIKRLPLALAASILIVAAAGIGTWDRFIRGTYSTDIGEQRSVTLKDGSVIDLNARSRIKIRYTADTRYIDLLEGQALFHVAKDHARPFIVRSAQTSVRVVGTQFDVYRKKTGTIVTVVEGRVAVFPADVHGGRFASRAEEVQPPRADDNLIQSESDKAIDASSDGERASARPEGSADPAEASRGRRSEERADGSVQNTPALQVHPEEILLAAGEQLSISATTAAKVPHANITAATAWTQHRLVFNSAPLSEVVEEFNRYNTRQLVIETPQLETFGVVGVFSSTDPGSLLRFLSAQPGIAIEESDAEIRITQKVTHEQTSLPR
jgi:transmembrane sensor